MQGKKLLTYTSLWYLGKVTENHAIYQKNKLTSLEKKEVESVEPAQFNTYRKDLSWLAKLAKAMSWEVASDKDQ